MRVPKKSCYLENRVVREPRKRTTACIFIKITSFGCCTNIPLLECFKATLHKELKIDLVIS